MGKLHKLPKRRLALNTIYCADNLAVMKQLPNESIDLIYIDPPFNTRSVQKSKAWDNEVQGIQYYDSFGKGINSYIAFMKDRLEQMHRLLKDTGSLFVHVDYRAVHYLKIELDKIFAGGDPDRGAKHLVNEIIWCYHDIAGGKNGNYFQRKHDTFLWYSKNQKNKFNIIRQPLADSTIKRYKKYFDKNGNLTYKKLKETNPGAFKSLKCIPKNINDIWIGVDKGAPMTDWWTDIKPIKRKGKGQSSEYIGYPTQKPLALLERIIKCASNEDDIIADFFCGCGTAISAAQSLNRHWVGVDASEKATKIMRKRMANDHGLDIPITPLGTLDKQKALELDPFEFERYMVTCVGGVVNKIQVGDGGLDGMMIEDGAPIQVKQSKKIGRPVIDSFYKHIKKRGRGFIIAISFTSTAKEEAMRLKNEEGIELVLLTVDQVIEQAA